MTERLTDFRLLAFFPADHADAAGGKLYVNGGYWSRLNPATFPHLLNLTLVAVLEVPFAKYQAEHTFRFGMENADGEALPLEVEGSFRVGADPELDYGEPSIMPITVGVGNLVIPSPSWYSFTLAVDGEVLGRFPFRAVQLQIPLQFQLGRPPAPPESEAS
jgi:hypothetical protein